MTHTRALIEAAEDVLEHRNSTSARAKLRAAISSAKAAEEGVEIRYVVEFLYHDAWVRGEPYLSAEEADRRIDSMAHRWKCRISREDTMKTVISVREKDGL